MSNYRLSNPQDGSLSRVDTSKPQIGIVKEATDSENMGRLKVWLKGSNTLETDPSGWITCNYASPFAGATDPTLLGGALESYNDTQKSYGFWAVPPDAGNEVIVIFINGDIRKAFWIACIYQKDMNHMVPGIAAGDSFQSGNFSGASVPVSEYNKSGNSASRRPYFQPLADGLNKQGLLGDQLRGAGSSSSRRNSPSDVYGFLTPGGQQLILDDGQNSELIRFRTKSGAQLLISETSGHIYAISRDGNSWLELNNDGNVDIYCGSSFNVQSIGDINFNCGGSFNVNAGVTANLRGSNVVIESSVGDVGIGSARNLDISVSENLNRTVLGDMHFYQEENKEVFVDIYSHPTSAIYTSPEQVNQAELATLNQVSLKNSLGQEEPGLSVCSRIPDREPWEGHSDFVRSAREQVEEVETSTASVGSVSTNPSKPLTVVGTPTPGMTPGVYSGSGYTENSEPTYEYVGPTTELQSPNTYKTSDAGLQFIATFEGFSSTVYLDAAGYPTIGYGHLITAKDPPHIKNGPLSREESLALLAEDVKIAEAAVRRYISVPLTQSQFDALVSFTFNLGGGSLRDSTLRRKLNGGDYSSVPSELMRWVRAGGKVLNGLIRRRREEGLMFARPAKSS